MNNTVDFKVQELWHELDDKTAVYKIINKVNQKYYVGSSVALGKRWRRHLFELRKTRHHCPYLQRAWSKYGEEAFEFQVVEFLHSELTVRAKEQELLDIGGKFLYNTSLRATGGDLISYHPLRSEIVRKISEGGKKRYQNMTKEEREELAEKVRGENNPMFGHVYSEETLEKLRRPRPNLSKALKGRKFSDEHRAKLSAIASNRKGDKNSFFGKSHSVETKAIIREKSLKRASLEPPGTAVKVVIDEVLYQSKTEAARFLGVSTPTILFRINSKNGNFSGYRLFDEIEDKNRKFDTPKSLGLVPIERKIIKSVDGRRRHTETAKFQMRKNRIKRNG